MVGTYRRGRISTIVLLVPFQLAAFHIDSLCVFLYKTTYFNEEVNPRAVPFQLGFPGYTTFLFLTQFRTKSKTVRRFGLITLILVYRYS
jgi:hypothetical protein